MNHRHTTKPTSSCDVLHSMQTIRLKRCTVCREEKPATSTHWHRHGPAKDGLKPRCKVCRRADSTDYYSANGDSVRQKARTWQRKNVERANRRKVEWARRNPERVREIKTAESLRNRERRKLDRRAQERHRWATSPAFRLKRRMAKRLKEVLRSGKGGRTWAATFGYTPRQLARHIERQFLPGMSWADVFAGRVHVDHIRPVASFGVTSIEDPRFRDCWALWNLRPLWASDNLKKASARLHLI